MEKFTRKIVDMMKEEELFEWQGGPIILAQVWFPAFEERENCFSLSNLSILFSR